MGQCCQSKDNKQMSKVRQAYGANTSYGYVTNDSDMSELTGQIKESQDISVMADLELSNRQKRISNQLVVKEPQEQVAVGAEPT